MASALHQRKSAVIEYRPALINGEHEWYWSVLPLPDEARAIAHGSANNRGKAAMQARQQARRNGYSITSVRIKHAFAEAAARRISGLMSLRESAKEKIVAAASKIRGKVYSGTYHPDAMWIAWKSGAFPELKSQEEFQKAWAEDKIQPEAEGFLTNTGRFVDRNEAFKIASKAAQIDPEADDLLRGRYELDAGDAFFGESGPDDIDPKSALNALPARYWLVSIEAVEAQEVIDYYVIAFDEKDALERLRKRGVIRPEPEDYVAAVIEVPKSDYDQFLKWQDEFGVYESVSSEAAKAEKPTEDQAKAGNYRKGHVSIFGLDISIENAKGSKRTGTNKQGKKWSVTMPAHYGYICGTKGKDKDHIDVYIGPDEKSEKVFVVNQKKEEGGFDEHKCMICFDDRKTAIATYDKAFTGNLGPKLRGSVVTTTMEKFKEWLKSEDTKTPFKSIAEALLEADPDDINAHDYISHVYNWRDALARLGFERHGDIYELRHSEQYAKYIGNYMILVADWKRKDTTIDIQFFQSTGKAWAFINDEQVPPAMTEIVVKRFIQRAELDEAIDPDAVDPKDYLEKLPKIQRCPYCRGTELSPENQAGYVYCFGCDKEFRPSAWNKVFEADPDAINPKDYLLNTGPFGISKGQHGWHLTFDGEPIEWLPDEKNATFYAVHGNELHKTKPFKGGLDNAINWYWREKYGKESYKGRSTDPRWNRRLNLRRPSSLEEAGPDDIDPRDALFGAFESPVPGYVTYKRQGFEASWQVSRVKTVAGQHLEIPVGYVYFDPQNDIPANANPVWRELNWHAAPNIGDGQFCRSFDEAVRFVAGKYRNRYGDPEIEESGPDDIDARQELRRYTKFDAEGLMDYVIASTKLPIDYRVLDNEGNLESAFVEFLFWSTKDRVIKLEQQRAVLDTALAYCQQNGWRVSGRGWNSNRDDRDRYWFSLEVTRQTAVDESEDPDAVDAKAFLNRTFPTRGTIKDFAWALDKYGCRGVGIRKQEGGWKVYGHFHGSARAAKAALAQVLEEFKLSNVPWTMESESPSSVVTRMFHTLIPLHLLDGAGHEDVTYPPGFLIRT